MAPAPHDVIATCPVCDGELQVTRLQCADCGTTLEGRFGVGRFGRLDREQLALLESFLRARGNLRDMERELGISYPTVRNRVESLVRALGLASPGPSDEPSTPAVPTPPLPPEPSRTPGGPEQPDVLSERRRVLERLAAHELSAEDAASILRALGGTASAGDG